MTTKNAVWNTSSGILFILFQLVCTLKQTSTCLSKEQFLASIDHSRTLVFEAILLQNYASYLSNNGYEAYVQITRIRQQSQFGWQLSPNSIAHVRGIRPRPVDTALCLPRLVNGKSYLWITGNSGLSVQTAEGSLEFYPGGLFLLEEQKPNEPAGIKSEPGQEAQVRPQTQSKFEDHLQQDAAYASQSSVAYPSGSVLQTQQRKVNSCDPIPCPLELRPVCGTDGVLYQNECLLRKRSCTERLSPYSSMRPMLVSVDYSNRCLNQYQKGYLKPNYALCEGNNLCNYGAKCPDTSTNTALSWGTVVPSTAIFTKCDCQHINCLNEWPDPVCGTDGETYSNECYLRKSMCVTQLPKRILYRGNCASNPCLTHTCRWPGERCEIDETGQPKCVCPDSCPKVMLPVCGSDGITYDSHCHLELTACMKMRQIWVIYAGQCSEEPQCQALGLHCQGYEVCTRIKAPPVYQIRSQQYSSLQSSNFQPMVAQCVCPTCPERGLGDQVCGTDGQTYRSECHLRASVCQRQLYGVKVRSIGPCDACSNKECKYYAICQKNADGEPQCICPTDCPYVQNGKTVCGSDGNMYEDECVLKVRSCAEQREIYVIHEGPCKTCPNGCPLGYQCRNGQCVCRDTCPVTSTVLEPEVCGTDGQLYRSECELKRQACVQQKEINADPSGASCRRLSDSNPGHLESARPQADAVDTNMCRCNKVGALSEFCDRRGRCRCKWYVQGDKCAQCVAGYWGIQNEHECIACSCHPNGSLGSNCDQMNGQCNCRPGVVGRQCSICPNGGRLTKTGCISNNETSTSKSTELRPPKKAVQTKLDDEAQSQITPLLTEVTTGRQFSPETTLLIPALKSFGQPFTIELDLVLSGQDGSLLQYRVAPTEQEQMLVKNLRDHQFRLAISGSRVECSYLNGRTPDRLYVIQSPGRIRPNTLHKIRVGVNNNKPWLQLDGIQTTLVTEATILQTPNAENSTQAGGYGTIVIGRPLLPPIRKTWPPSSPRENEGFEGCLLRVKLMTDSMQQAKPIDLSSGGNTKLAWIGVKRLSSGISGAPLCSSNGDFSSKTEGRYADDLAKPIQSDGSTNDHPDEPVTVCTRKQPCLNGGICIPTRTAEYDCICQPGWQGQRCEQAVTVIPQFGGDSFIRLPGPKGPQAMNGKRMRIGITFLVTQVPGLLFFVPPATSMGPFVGAYIDPKGYLFVVCRIELPPQQAKYRRGSSGPSGDTMLLPYKMPLQLRRWHVLTIDKRPKVMSVVVDGNKPQRLRLLPSALRRYLRKRRLASLPNFDVSSSPIYLGGYDFRTDPSSHMDIRTGLVGAIQQVNINGADIFFVGPPTPNIAPAQNALPDTSEYWLNVSQWQGPPCGPAYNPCRIDGLQSVCRPLGTRATCACSTQLQLVQFMREQGTNDAKWAEAFACQQKQAALDALHRKAESFNTDATQKPWVDQDVQYDALPKSPELSEVQKKQDLGKEDTEASSKTEVCAQLAVSFSGGTIFKFLDLMKSMTEYHLRVQLQTTSRDGLILLIGDTLTGPGTRGHLHSGFTNQRELTMLALRKGRVEYSIFVASGLATDASDKRIALITGRVSTTLLQIQSKVELNDGRCHTVNVARSGRRATLIIDHQMVSGEFLTPPTSIHQENYVQLGGAMLNITGIPWEYQQNFTGCIGDMFLNEQKVPMLTSAFEIRGPIIPCR